MAKAHRAFALGATTVGAQMSQPHRLTVEIAFRNRLAIKSKDAADAAHDSVQKFQRADSPIYMSDLPVPAQLFEMEAS
jgi:hypothetical protein